MTRKSKISVIPRSVCSVGISFSNQKKENQSASCNDVTAVAGSDGMREAKQYDVIRKKYRRLRKRDRNQRRENIFRRGNGTGSTERRGKIGRNTAPHYKKSCLRKIANRILLLNFPMQMIIALRQGKKRRHNGHIWLNFLTQPQGN